MQFDIETVIEDNVRLKKVLQMAKISQQSSQKQYKQLKALYDESIERNRNLKNDYCDLQKKYQNSYSQTTKDNNSLIAQIDQLKQIVQDKQRDLEQMQIKIIPNLDQDMLRVKLISEMEGPYQQTVDKKDKQIFKLKQKVSALQRKLQISQMSMNSKLSSAKKQLEQMKSYYQNQNENLLQQLNIAISRNQCRSVQSGIIKNQKKQIDQLRANLQFMNQTHQQLQCQYSQIKKQRNQLLQKIALMNENQALFIQSKNSQNQIQKLKQQKSQFQKLYLKFKGEFEKLERKLQAIQQQKNKQSNDYEKQLIQERNKFNSEKLQLQNQMSELKDQIRRLRSFKAQNQTDRETLYQKLHYLETQLKAKTQQYNQLYTSRRTQKDIGCWDGFMGNKKGDQKKQNNSLINNIQKNIHNLENKTDKEKENLARENLKLKNKLKQANSKIMELLRQKMQNSDQSPQRDRARSHIQKPIGVFLQYQDCSLKPLVQPTLYTYNRTKKMK